MFLMLPALHALFPQTPYQNQQPHPRRSPPFPTATTCDLMHGAVTARLSSTNRCGACAIIPAVLFAFACEKSAP